MEYSNKILIAAYQQKNQDEVRDIYTQWFNKGKINPDAFAKKMNTLIPQHYSLTLFISA